MMKGTQMGTMCGTILAALVAAISCAHAGEVPRPAFSFKYGDRAVTGSESVQVDAHLKVTVESIRNNIR